ncbi:MAG: hypothetical protein ACWGN7_05800, partial [Thermodesulfovibrionales bacterium]
ATPPWQQGSFPWISNILNSTIRKGIMHLRAMCSQKLCLNLMPTADNRNSTTDVIVLRSGTCGTRRPGSFTLDVQFRPVPQMKT